MKRNLLLLFLLPLALAANPENENAGTAQTWRHQLSHLGNATGSKLVTPGANGSDAAMRLDYDQGPWSRFNWPLVKPAKVDKIQFQARRDTDLPKDIQIRVLTLDGIEWYTKKHLNLTNAWQTFTLTADDFTYFRSGDPNNLPKLDFANLVQFQLLPMQNSTGAGAIIVDTVQFLPDGPTFTHDKEEWKVPVDPVKTEYDRLKDIEARTQVELIRINDNIEQLNKWDATLRQILAKPEEATQILKSNQLPWKQPNSVPINDAAFDFPTFDQYKDEIKKLDSEEPKVIFDASKDTDGIFNHVLYKATTQPKPTIVKEDGAAFVRQNIIFTDNPGDQTVFLNINIPKHACNNGQFLDITDCVITTTLRCGAKQLNPELPFLLRTCAQLPDNAESFIDIPPVPFPSAEWQDVDFNVAKPKRAARRETETIFRLAFRLQNVNGSPDNFNLDVRKITIKPRPAIEQVTQQQLDQRAKRLLEARTKLLKLRTQIATREESLRRLPEIHAQYMNSFATKFVFVETNKPVTQEIPKLLPPANAPAFTTKNSLVEGWLTVVIKADQDLKHDTLTAFLLDAINAERKLAYATTKGGKQLRLNAHCPLWAPQTPNQFTLVIFAEQDGRVVAHDTRQVGLRHAQVLQSSPSTILRHVSRRNMPDWAYVYNGQPAFFRTAAVPGFISSLEKCPVESVRMLHDLWTEGTRFYGMTRSKSTWSLLEKHGITQLASATPSYKSLKSFDDLDQFLYDFDFSADLLAPLLSKASPQVIQVGNEVELDSWGASINDAFPQTAFQPLDAIAQKVRQRNLDNAPIMYVRAGHFKTVEPLPHEDISGINQYTGRYSGRLDEVPRDLAELAAEATLFNRPLAITEWNGPKYSWATSGIGGIHTRGAAYYLEKYWRAMIATPAIIGSAEFTLNWIYAPFEDLTNQTKEQAYLNRPPHEKFGGGWTSDHVPLVMADAVAPDDCYHSMQAFHSPLYIMLNNPGDIVSNLPNTNEINADLTAIGKNVRHNADLNFANLPDNAHAILVLNLRPLAIYGIQPLPAEATEPSVQTILNPKSPNHLLSVIQTNDEAALQRAITRFEQTAKHLRQLRQLEANMPRLLALTDRRNVNVFERYIMDQVARGYAFSGNDTRTSLDYKEFIDENNNLKPAWNSLAAIFLDAHRLLEKNEIDTIQALRQHGVALVISRSCHNHNPFLQQLAAATFTPAGTFIQKLLPNQLTSPIPLKILGEANMKAILEFDAERSAKHNGLNVATIKANDATPLATNTNGEPVIAKLQNDGAPIILLGYDLGDTSFVHWRVTHFGKTHPIYDRDTACGLERPAIAAVNAALKFNLRKPASSTLKVQIIPKSFLVDNGKPQFQIIVTDQDGNTPDNIQLQARTRLRVDGQNRQSSPYVTLAQAKPGLFNITAAPLQDGNIDGNNPKDTIPYFPYAKKRKIAKILSVQLKVFANNHIPQDAACAFVLTE